MIAKITFVCFCLAALVSLWQVIKAPTGRERMWAFLGFVFNCFIAYLAWNASRRAAEEQNRREHPELYDGMQYDQYSREYYARSGTPEQKRKLGL